MSNATFDPTPAVLEEKLALYWKLVNESKLIESRIARARGDKTTVSERVFQKVLADYESAHEGVVSRLNPLKQELDELRRTVSEEIKEVDVTVTELEDEVAEADFRHRVGEFDEPELRQVMDGLAPRLEKAARRKGELEVQLKALDRRRPDESRGSAPEESPNASKAPSLENPQDWARELKPPASETTAPTPAPEAAPAPTPIPASSPVSAALEEEDDPLAALTDPTPAADPVSTAPAPQAEPTQGIATAAPTFPNLVIRTGAHAGKIVPLLPMTMSIGREHDNNIELKDPEVARYHARIVYEDGRFFVEDLDSSTGTWVNGERQSKAALNDRDVIRIGESELAIDFN